MTQALSTNRFIQGEECWVGFPGHPHQMRYLKLKAERPSGKSPVVFIHGFLGYTFSWRFNLREFARDRDVYAVDLLGMGFSDRPLEGPGVSFAMEAAGQRVLQLLDSLGLRNVDVVGTSHGGAVTMTMAICDRRDGKDRIGRMVLVAPANYYSTRGRTRIWFFKTKIGARLLRAFGGLRLIKDLGLDFMYGDFRKITPETRDGYFLMIKDPASFDYALSVIRSWWPDMGAIVQGAPAYENMPTLLVWGDRDRAVPTRSSAPLARHFKNAKLVIMKGSGHLPYEEAPEEFNRIVLDWLDREEPATRARG